MNYDEPVLMALDMLKWEKRSIVLAAFGLVGFGALAGAGSVYYLYVKSKIESHFQLQTDIIQDLTHLRGSVEAIQSSLTRLNNTEDGSNNILFSVSGTKVYPKLKSVGRKQSSEDGNESDYQTASDSEEDENEVEVKRLKSEQNRDGSNENIEDEGNRNGGGESSEQYQLAQYFAKADALLEGGVDSQHEAYNMLKINKIKLQYSSDFWWRLAKATHMEGAAAGVAGNKELRRAHIETAVTYAEKALKLNNLSADAHKWYAVTLGNQTEFLGINEKIKVGFTFKEHVDRAVMLNPQDSTCYYLLGRFCLEVSQLSWIERRVAATLFSKPPDSTPKEALEYLKKCENLRPLLDNRFFMAKCYFAMGDNKQGAKWLQICANMPAEGASDKSTRELVLQLLTKYRKYLN